ncbi:hypothetical protein E2C01_041087 [Portunus trituberculatus]|uniref:Uncharacterized protein n=1 Tax=Portunus trituberculatus TaxID=210409 RepID=A0A5B7FPD8_PORTR|nr:hypothetical protein [Portunus trituberculatus]
MSVGTVQIWCWETRAWVLGQHRARMKDRNREAGLELSHQARASKDDVVCIFRLCLASCYGALFGFILPLLLN